MKVDLKVNAVTYKKNSFRLTQNYFHNYFHKNNGSFFKMVPDNTEVTWYKDCKDVSKRPTGHLRHLTAIHWIIISGMQSRRRYKQTV